MNVDCRGNLEKIFTDLKKDFFIRYRTKKSDKWNYFFAEKVSEDGLDGKYLLEEGNYLPFYDLFENNEIEVSMWFKPE